MPQTLSVRIPTIDGGDVEGDAPAFSEQSVQRIENLSQYTLIFSGYP